MNFSNKNRSWLNGLSIKTGLECNCGISVAGGDKKQMKLGDLRDKSEEVKTLRTFLK